MNYILSENLGLRQVSFVAFGEPASKANSRKLVFFGKRPAFIKSDKARKYTETFKSQCPRLEHPFEKDVKVEIKIWYASRRPDLDESVILDAMQGYVYENDRQVKFKSIEWGLDRKAPRSEICVSEIHLLPVERFCAGHEEGREDGKGGGRVVSKRRGRGNPK